MAAAVGWSAAAACFEMVSKLYQETNTAQWNALTVFSLLEAVYVCEAVEV